MSSRTDRNHTVAGDLRRSASVGAGLGRRVLVLAITLVATIGTVPLASAHGGHIYVNGVHLSQSYALIPLVLGAAIAVGSIYLPRLRPALSDYALRGVLVGLAVAVVGGIAVVQLSPYEWLTAEPVIPRSIHEPLLLLLGSVIMLGSVIGGQLRWPTRPRYAGFGALLGLWVAYPGFSVFGVYTPTNPLGHLIVLSLPVAVGYVLWRDARGVLSAVFADRTARRFGVAVGLLGVVFFLFSAGMATVVPDSGEGLSWSSGFITTLPTLGPLVTWPSVEVWAPSIPFAGMVSVGTLILLAVLGGLLGLNAAVFAHQWGTAAGGASPTTAGAVGLAAPQACCCCGPLLSQLAIVTLGPSAAAPIYLLFADPSSSIGSLFFVASVAILAGTLINATGSTANADPEQCVVPA
ncbi:hypothetical protein [Halococcus saccharolyticus]|uniref:Uncharacterized protein n=1 Tax=Halococcus saccharolyticus DSM 5350 TaxID=1227455 RepID=M0MLL9_9EURY|nr:hypothetical protein [Halococcus saccharolyticus]EMA45350.1 hypothetical protein C449_06985 [Halococcus saccharolyticus DSM 5350]